VIRLRSSSATDVGMVRTTNQDRAFEGDGLYAVADGMGGHVGGETAAQTAIEAFQTTFAGHPSADGLADAVRQAGAWGRRSRRWRWSPSTAGRT